MKKLILLLLSISLLLLSINLVSAANETIPNLDVDDYGANSAGIVLCAAAGGGQQNVSFLFLPNQTAQITTVEIMLNNVGSANGDVAVDIYNTSSDADHTPDSIIYRFNNSHIASADIGVNPATTLHNITGGNVSVTSGTYYALVFSVNGTSNCVANYMRAIPRTSEAWFNNTIFTKQGTDVWTLVQRDIRWGAFRMWGSEFISSDTTPPTFTQIPQNTTIEYFQDILNLKINATDETAFGNFSINDTTNFNITLDGNLINKTTLTIARYHLNVSIIDTSLNQNHLIFQLDVNDTIAPQITTVPGNVTLEYFIDLLRIVFIASDFNIFDRFYINNTVQYNMSFNGTLINITNLPIGSHTVIVFANDSFNNTNTSHFGITVQDTIAPNLSVIPGNVTLEYGIDHLKVNYTAFDVSPISSFYTNDSTNFNISFNGNLTNNTILSLGNHNIIVFVNDTSNNTNTSHFNAFVQDTTSATFSNAINSSENFSRGQNYTANITITDFNLNYYIFAHNTSGTWANVTVFLSGTGAIKNANSSVNITQPRNSHICWYYWANDTQKNEAKSSEHCFNVSNSAPTVSINAPEENNFNNTELQAIFTPNDLDGDTLFASLFINGTVNATNSSIINGTSTFLNSTGFDNGHYEWIIQICDDGNASCTNSTPRTYIHDNVTPTITLFNPTSNHNSRNTNLTLSLFVEDSNLFMTNLTVFNPDGSIFTWNNSLNLTGNISWNINDTINFEQQGNFTAEALAGDSHTFGDLNGLQYGFDKKGITFTKGLFSRRVYFGYVSGGNYQFLTDAVINNYNISVSIENRSSEYSWKLNYKKPASDTKFFFALKQEPNLRLIDSSTGHFVWWNGIKNSFYFDHTEIIDAGYELNYTTKTVNSEDYHVLYSSTVYCQSNVGEMCQI